MDYNKILSDKIKNIKPSGIRKFFDIAAQTEGVISLGVGEPDFPTPWSVRKVAIDTIERKRTVYTANPGLIELRKVICDRLDKKMGLKYDTDEVIVTVGGSEAIDLAIRAIIDPGDEVLVVEPSFVCYAPITELSGGVVVPLETSADTDFKLTAETLRSKITDKTKMLILPYPNNPTGGIMTKEELLPIAEVLKNTNIVVLSDEIYSELTYGGEKHTSIAQLDGMKERTIIVNGFSKAYAMTGWRLGYVTGPKPIIEQMLKLHQYAIMSSPTISQYAGIEAIKNCDGEIAKMVKEYDARRRLIVKEFNRMGLTCFEPKGAFYVFPCIKSTGLSSEEFCARLVEEYKVAIVPGNAFGSSGEGYVRVSYAYSINHILEALKRIEAFLKSLENGK
ncbi:MAG: aminotransferase class I/II-fold pyridoxal phosphate-dependent enzyme [Oscillospiraceae bacterium]|nr:aminotransferase class I/II-fold pyridoxal phosphate-dependent enzyme [Oscillospiraceae bacterium]